MRIPSPATPCPGRRRSPTFLWGVTRTDAHGADPARRRVGRFLMGVTRPASKSPHAPSRRPRPLPPPPPRAPRSRREKRKFLGEMARGMRTGVARPNVRRYGGDPASVGRFCGGRPGPSDAGGGDRARRKRRRASRAWGGGGAAVGWRWGGRRARPLPPPDPPRASGALTVAMHVATGCSGRRGTFVSKHLPGFTGGFYWAARRWRSRPRRGVGTTTAGCPGARAAARGPGRGRAAAWWGGDSEVGGGEGAAATATPSPIFRRRPGRAPGGAVAFVRGTCPAAGSFRAADRCTRPTGQDGCPGLMRRGDGKSELIEGVEF
jgi:hypothetical protein